MKDCNKRLKAIALCIICFAAFSAISSSAGAEEWPPDRMTIILSHGTGGGQDRLTRAFGKIWEEYLGTQFVYNNKRGASGRIGYDYFLDSDAVILSSNQASASIMYKQQDPDWDWEERLYPFGIMGVDPGAIFVRADSEIDSLQELIDAAKDHKVTFGISYWTSPDNIMMHQIMDATGADFEIIPYGNAREMTTSLVGGHLGAGYTKVTNILNQEEATKFLGLSMDENTIPELTDNIPPIRDVVGVDTLPIASYRVLLVKKDWKEKYPERYKTLKETFEKAKDDERFIEEAEKLGIPSGLIPDWDNERIMKIVRSYWDSYEEWGHIFGEKN